MYIRQFGQKRGGEGELNCPISIAIDYNDVVYIGEDGNQCISLLTRDGHFLKAFGAQGSGPRQFNAPRGITINEDGTLFIRDYGYKGVQMF